MNVGQFGAGVWPAAVLPERDVAIDQRCFDRGKFRGPHIFLAQKLVDRPRAGRRQKHAFRIHPAVAIW